MPWFVLGTLVVINSDDGDYLKANSVQTTPFNAPLEWCSMHSARARVGGSKSGQQSFFPKVFLDLLGCSNKWLSATLSHLGPT